MLDSETEESYNGVIRDITERKQAEALRKARDLARTSAKMKEKFIASISHEMRTPMNAILGMSNLVIQTELDPEQFNYINSIKQSSELLLGIVNDILEISTLENGKIQFENKDFDLKELLKNLVNVMQYKVDEKNLKLIIDIGEDVPQFIKGDNLRLNQVLYNLVGNAVKFTDVGYIHIRVLNLYDGDDDVFLKFEVEDTGIGIPKDKVAAVFETFTRIRTKDRIYEGTGLGLSIVKNLLELMNSKVYLESVLGQGSKFWFDISFNISEDTFGDTDLGNKAYNIDYKSLEKVSILVVEDNKINQMITKKILEKHKIICKVADNGLDAIKMVKENDFKLILMDIHMPGISGIETTQLIREFDKKLPIIALTAVTIDENLDEFYKAGFNEIIPKPFKPEDFFEKISYTLKAS